MGDQENPDSPVSEFVALKRRAQLRDIRRVLNLAHHEITDNYNDSLAELLDAIDAAIVLTYQHD